MRIEATKQILQDLRHDVASILSRIDVALEKVDELEKMSKRANAHTVYGLVLEYMKDTKAPKAPREVHADVKLALPHASIDAVAQALYRLGKKGILRHVGRGEYELA